MRHQYGISVAESQTFLLAKRPSAAMSEEKLLPFAGYIMVNTAIFILTFIRLLFNSLFICLKSEIFTYCLECGVKRLGQGWIGAIQILMIII